MRGGEIRILRSLCFPPLLNFETIKTMKKETKITQDKTQTRSTIPKELVDKHKVTKKDSIEWDDEDGKLKGKLKKK